PPREIGAESRPGGAGVHAGVHEGHLHVAGPAGHPAYVVVLVAVLVHVAGAAAPVVGERRAVMASVYLARGSGRTQDPPGAQPFDLGVAPGDQRPGFDHGERRGLAPVMPARSVAP